MPPKDAQDNQETSMRDDFDAAIETVENDEGTFTVETAADADEQAPITAEDLNGDAEKAETKAKAKVEAEAGEAVAEADKSAADQSGADDSGTEGGSADAASDAGVDKAPESWPPAAREGWKDVPETVRAQISKREGEIDKALNVGAQDRKTGAAFQGIADRYAQVIAAEGATDALTGIEELVKTVATLRMGSKEQKAQKIAGFIEHYGIDVPMLDDILSGTPAAADPNALPPLDPRVESLLSGLESQKRANQFQKNQDAINEVMTFKQDASHEFYDDVKNDMADMVEMAEKRGVVMPLQDAYDKACALNPEISGVVAKRAADQALIGSDATLDAKRNASVSIAGKQGGAPSTNTDGMSMRDTITAALDAQHG